MDLFEHRAGLEAQPRLVIADSGAEFGGFVTVMNPGPEDPGKRHNRANAPVG